MNRCDFPYVGKWVGPKGCATVVLIAADWVITAYHAAKNKIDNPGIDVGVRFSDRDGNVSTAKVREAFASNDAAINWWNIALAKLDRRVENIPIASLAMNAIPCGQEIQLTIVASELIRPAYYGRHNVSGHLVRDHDRGSGVRGVPGDSGGACVFQNAARNLEVVVGVIQGRTHDDKGAASQPSAFRDWIERTMERFHANATWATLDYD